MPAKWRAFEKMDLLDGDALDFYQSILGQACSLKCSAGRIGSGEELGVNSVHGGKVSNVSQQHGGLDHVAHVSTGFRQNGFDVGQALTGLGGDVVACKSTGGGINGNLTGDVDGIACLNGLRIGTDGGGGIVGMDGKSEVDRLWQSAKL